MSEDTTIQPASVPVPSAAAVPSTPAPVSTPNPAPASADSTGAPPQKPAEKMIPQSEVERMMKERTKNLAAFKEAYEEMVEAGLIDRNQFVSPADVVRYIRESRTQTAHQKAQTTGDVTDYARITAKNEASAATLDVRIDFAAERLAEKDPLFADIADPQVLAEIRPLARLMGGDVKGAYLARYGDAFSSRQKAMLEARITADMQAKANKQVESADGAEGTELGLSADELQVAKMVGMDPKKYKALKEIDNFGDYAKQFKK